MSQLTLDSNNSIYYRQLAGDAEMPTLVFLHEGLGCTAMWQQFPEMVCRSTGCPGLLYDRVGHGGSSAALSPRNPEYLNQHALTELPAVLNALIPGVSYILVGHSDGGSISLIWAAQKPQHLLGVITEAAHVFVEDKTLAGIADAVRAYAEGRFQALNRYHGIKTDSLFTTWSETWLSSSFRSWNIEKMLPRINCPLLVIQGIEDQYGTVRQVDTIVSKSSGSAKSVMVDNCGHAPHLEQAASVLNTMTRFVYTIAAQQRKS